MRFRPLAVVLPSAIAALVAGAPTADAALTARIDVKGRYYRAGEPVEVRLTLENEGDAAVANAEGIPLWTGVKVRAGDEVLSAAKPPAFDAASQPKTFLPGAGLQQVLDLADQFPALKEPGTYEVWFEGDSVRSEHIRVWVAHPYDPELNYRATFKTDYGEIKFDLLEDVAPEHVMNFVDLARKDYYDGTKFHLIVRGELLAGGDPMGDGSGGTGYILLPELSTLPHERGTLSAVRFGGNDNGSQFFIDLRRNMDRDGNFSIFGKMLEGDQTLAALENLPTSGQNYQPFYRPLQDVKVLDVVIEAVAPEAATGQPGAPGKPEGTAGSDGR